MPAPKLNLNSAKNGTTMKRLTVGELPSQLRAVKIEGRKYRRAMEDEVLQIKGLVSTTDAHVIDLAVASQISCGIVRWLLRERIETMTNADILNCAQQLLKAKEMRNKAIEKLRLDVRHKVQDSIDALYEPEPEEEADGDGWDKS